LHECRRTDGGLQSEPAETPALHIQCTHLLTLKLDTEHRLVKLYRPFHVAYRNLEPSDHVVLLFHLFFLYASSPKKERKFL
jgi:hypothetical protein